MEFNRQAADQTQPVEENSKTEACRKDEGARQTESEDEKPPPAERKAMLQQGEEVVCKRLPSIRQQVQIKLQWEACTTYSAMLQLSREFLRGYLPCTPYYPEPIDGETIPLLNSLIQLHDYGFLTTGCQPSKREGPKFLVRFPYREDSDCFYECRQRAYLRFFVPTDGSVSLEKVKSFCLSLAEHPDINTKIGTGCSHSIRYGDFAMQTSLVTTNDDKTIISPHSPQSTWEHSVQSLLIKRFLPWPSEKRDLGSVPWLTQYATTRETTEMAWALKLPRLVTLVHPLIVEVHVKSWDVCLDLAALVRELADAAGIERSFSE